jgi:hypothetical protein
MIWYNMKVPVLEKEASRPNLTALSLSLNEKEAIAQPVLMKIVTLAN